MRPLFLQGHSRPLTWVAFNRDGDLLFTCGKDARLAVWNADNGERIGTYDVGKGVVWNCDCTLDSRRLVCASADQRVMVFDVLTGAILHDIQEAGPCKFVEWNRKPDEQNKFVLAHDSFGTQASKAIKVWQVDGPNGKPRRLWSQDDYCGRCVQVRWGPFDQTIISCHENGDIMCKYKCVLVCDEWELHPFLYTQIWNAETGEYINEFRAHKQFITCLSFSEDRLLMLSCCSDGTAKLWDTVDFNCIKNYQTDRPLNACDISPRFNKTGEERRCHILLGGGQAAEEVTTTASGEGKFEALLFHLVYQEELGSCKGHFGPLNTLAWRPDGGGYASGGEDGYVRIYHFDEEYFTDKFEP